MEKKYILTDETAEICGHTLHRVQAVKDFGDVKVGDLGGWIESEENLSHEEDCWVDDEAKIFEDARVYGNARVYDNALIYGKARVYDNVRVYGSAKIFENAQVYGDTLVYENAWLYGNAIISGNAIIHMNAQVYENAIISGNASMYGESKLHGHAVIGGHTLLYHNAEISGNNVHIVTGISRITTAHITSPNDFISIGPIGSRDDFTIFYKTKGADIWVSCGCFTGSIEDFEKAVEKTHGDNLYARQYMGAIHYARRIFNL